MRHDAHQRMRQIGLLQIGEFLLREGKLHSGNRAVDMGEFGGNDDLLAFGEVAQGAAYLLLAGAVLIADGCIKKVDAAFQRIGQNFAGRRFGQCPLMLAGSRIAKSHATKADAGDGERGNCPT